MTPLAVWAPNASVVELEIRGVRRRPMRQHDERGWWLADLDDEVDYAFVIDGGPPLPDPRAPWLPSGVFAPARPIDHTRFRWTDQEWEPTPLSSALIYELHVGTFSAEGTFDGVLGHLDHLTNLGVTHVELMPVNSFPGVRGWGYDGVGLYAPHEPYGGPDGLKRLVDGCHARGLGVILDVVYNHLGPSGNHLPRFGPYFTDRYRTPWGDAVNLDGRGSDVVRRFFCDNALQWLRDYHVDGLRLDAVHALFDRSATHFLEQLRNEVDLLEAETGKRRVLIAESDLNDPRIVRGRESGGYGLDAQWSDDFHHAVHAVLTGERNGYYRDFGTVGDLAKALQEGFVYDGRYSIHRERSHGRPAHGLSGKQFVVCIQNHDQVGNRARGDRLHHLVGARRARMAAAILMTSPFVPLLFQGEEWAATSPFPYFTDHQDPGLGEMVRAGRQRELAAFGWKPEDIPDPQAPSTFEHARLDWGELEREPHAAMLDWYRRLIRLRRTVPSLGDDHPEGVGAQRDDRGRWLVIERGPIRIGCNFASEPQRILRGGGRMRLLLASDDDVRVTAAGLDVPAESVAIVVRED